MEPVGAAPQEASSEPTVVFSYADADALQQARLQAMQMSVQRRLRELAAQKQRQEQELTCGDDTQMNPFAIGALRSQQKGDQTLFSDLVVPPELGKKGAQLETSRVIVHGHPSDYQTLKPPPPKKDDFQALDVVDQSPPSPKKKPAPRARPKTAGAGTGNSLMNELKKSLQTTFVPVDVEVEGRPGNAMSSSRHVFDTVRHEADHLLTRPPRHSGHEARPAGGKKGHWAGFVSGGHGSAESDPSLTHVVEESLVGVPGPTAAASSAVPAKQQQQQQPSSPRQPSISGSVGSSGAPAPLLSGSASGSQPGQPGSSQRASSGSDATASPSARDQPQQQSSTAAATTTTSFRPASMDLPPSQYSGSLLRQESAGPSAAASRHPAPHTHQHQHQRQAPLSPYLQPTRPASARPSRPAPLAPAASSPPMTRQHGMVAGTTSLLSSVERQRRHSAAATAATAKTMNRIRSGRLFHETSPYSPAFTTQTPTVASIEAAALSKKREDLQFRVLDFTSRQVISSMDEQGLLTGCLSGTAQVQGSWDAGASTAGRPESAPTMQRGWSASTARVPARPFSAVGAGLSGRPASARSFASCSTTRPQSALLASATGVISKRSRPPSAGLWGGRPSLVAANMEGSGEGDETVLLAQGWDNGTRNLSMHQVTPFGTSLPIGG